MLVSPILLTTLVALQAHPVAVIDSTVRRGIDEGVYPGAVVAIGTADTILLLKGYGGLAWSATLDAPSPDHTLYDLASLTKVVAATPAVMVLVTRGDLKLDAPVRSYLPNFLGAGKDSVTVRHLLAHTSGLRAFLPLHTLTADAASARRRVEEEPLRAPPGSRVEYSDLNAMLVGWVVESVTGQTLDEFATDAVFGPLEMSSTRFRLARDDRARAAPINVWRGTVIRGIVHDQNAERLGGVSGHAGLYSTAADLARYAQMYLNGGRSRDGSQIIATGVVQEFTRSAAQHRGYGWEINDTTDVSNTGRRLSSSAFGHTGFTGTSLWIDPELDLFVVLLTNRVFAPRTRGSITKLKHIRGEVADAAVSLRQHACRIERMVGAAPRICP